jgi:hypothetical protein
VLTERIEHIPGYVKGLTHSQNLGYNTLPVCGVEILLHIHTDKGVWREITSVVMKKYD